MTIIEDNGVTTYNHWATMGFNRGKVSLHCNTQNTEHRQPSDHLCRPTKPPSHPIYPASHPIYPASQPSYPPSQPSYPEHPCQPLRAHWGANSSTHHSTKKLQHNCEKQISPEEEHRNDKLNISSLDIVPRTLAFYLLYCLEIFRILKVVDTASTGGLKLGKSNFNRLV